jgi:hypothetical protein
MMAYLRRYCAYRARLAAYPLTLSERARRQIWNETR